MSFQQEGTIRRSWAKRGKGFTVYHHPCKRRAKYFGAVTLEADPRLEFRPAEEFNSRTFEGFVCQLLARFPKIFLILDNARFHKAKRLQPFFAAHADRLTIFHLPPYSPELNAVEMVWRETRKDATHNRYFATQRGLRRAVQTQFRAYQANGQRLAGTVAQFLRL